MEQLRKRGRSLVTNPAGNPCDRLIAGFKQERRLRHPAFDHITVHRLADELGKTRRKHRAAEPHALAKVAQSPRPLRVFVDKLKRRSDMAVRYGSEPAALAGTERRDPASHERLVGKTVRHASEAAERGRARKRVYQWRDGRSMVRPVGLHAVCAQLNVREVVVHRSVARPLIDRSRRQCWRNEPEFLAGEQAAAATGATVSLVRSSKRPAPKTKWTFAMQQFFRWRSAAWVSRLRSTMS